MAISDLSLVSNSILNLLRDRVNSGMGEPTPIVAYSLLPSDTPDEAATVSLHLYLYHVLEDPYQRNEPPIVGGEQDVRFNSMGLQLYYQLTVTGKKLDDNVMPKAQHAFGLALKALHDHPRLDARTLATYSDIGRPDLRSTPDLVRISMMNIPAEQAGQYWSSSKEPIRLAAYYMVTATFLQPEPVTKFAGRVLSLGVYPFASGAPRLHASHSQVTFTPPLATEMTVEMQPAEAAINDSFYLECSDIGGGALTLRVRRADWVLPIVVTDWNVEIKSDRIYVKVPADLNGPLMPGVYLASISIAKGVGGPMISNEVPFVITPAVDSISSIAADFTFTLTGGLFPLPAAPPPEIPTPVQVIIGGDAIPIKPQLGAAPTVYFEIISATVITVHLAATPPTPVPIRVIVNGAECAPRWII